MFKINSLECILFVGAIIVNFVRVKVEFLIENKLLLARIKVLQPSRNGDL